MELSNNNTVLVTGAAGFIGLNVVKEYLKHDWKVFALVHKHIPKILKELENVQIIQGDVTDKNFIESLNLNVDVVTHVAGRASDIGDDEIFRKINFEPIKYLCKLPKKKFVYVSTSDVYGIKDFDNADEGSPLCEFPKNPYPKYKIISENWLRENCKVDYVIIRPAAVWGKDDKTLEKRFVDFLEVSPFIIHFGKWHGKNRWPLANVQNVARVIAIVSLIDKYNNQAITIIDEKKTSIDEYYREIAKKYFPNKKYKTITLPFWIGKLIGLVSTMISNFLKMKHPIFEPTYYAVHHVSSNLDFSSKKMLEVLKYDTNKKVILKKN